MKDERGKRREERGYLIIKQALRLRYACVMPQPSKASAEWHLYPQNMQLEIPTEAAKREQKPILREKRRKNNIFCIFFVKKFAE